jgi:hypothetical protein
MEGKLFIIASGAGRIPGLSNLSGICLLIIIYLNLSMLVLPTSWCIASQNNGVVP